MEISRQRPLTISRGSSSTTNNLFVFVEHGGFTGVGEMAPIGYSGQDAASAEAQLSSASTSLEGLEPWRLTEVEKQLAGVGSAARAAAVNACCDWHGKALGVPAYRIFGFTDQMSPTSITVGINPPEIIRTLVPELLAAVGTSLLKLKLGSPEGIEADKLSFAAAAEAAPPGSRIRIDANGGWSVADACSMAGWLADRGCEYIEQPLGFGLEDGLAEIMRVRRIPIFLDEFIATSRDVVRFAHVCDGINVKLMKSGGVLEAIRCVHTARAHGLQTMIGCFGESSVGIAAGAAIGSLFDFIDLDSHLNLEPDPADGLGLKNGCIQLPDAPGLGVSLN
jgi:L-alanine-DL-glutamate epimerase-like enolase superfamily enzyme